MDLHIWSESLLELAGGDMRGHPLCVGNVREMTETNNDFVCDMPHCAKAQIAIASNTANFVFISFLSIAECCREKSATGVHRPASTR